MTEKVLRIGSTIKFTRDSDNLEGNVHISEGTIATVTEIGTFHGTSYINLEHFTNEQGDEILMTGWGGEGYNGIWYFQDFEAIEILDGIPD